MPSLITHTALLAHPVLGILLVAAVACVLMLRSAGTIRQSTRDLLLFHVVAAWSIARHPVIAELLRLL